MGLVGNSYFILMSPRWGLIGNSYIYFIMISSRWDWVAQGFPLGYFYVVPMGLDWLAPEERNNNKNKGSISKKLQRSGIMSVLGLTH